MNLIFLIEGKIIPWAPVIFGAIILSPMLAAVMNEANITLPYDIPNLAATTIIGVVWGYIAKRRSRWL
jgi:hypothetical protein